MPQVAQHNGAVILLSGGIDSATVLSMAIKESDACLALTFRYGQKHEAEVQAARRIAEHVGLQRHVIIDLPLGEHLRSALTDESVAVPRHDGDLPASGNIPDTYVPARNTIFLSCALAIAETTDSNSIYIGVSSVDYSGYPDCRPEFIQAFQNLAAVATRRSVEGHPIGLRAPLLHLSKAETILQGIELGVDYSLTLSCYAPDNEGRACDRCDSCRLRRRGFEEAGVKDPTRYQDQA